MSDSASRAFCRALVSVTVLEMPMGGAIHVKIEPAERLAFVPLVTLTNCTGCVFGGPSVVTAAVVSTVIWLVPSIAWVPAGMSTAGAVAVGSPAPPVEMVAPRAP